MRKVHVEINDKPVTILILDDCHVSTGRVLQEVKFASMIGAIGEEDDHKKNLLDTYTIRSKELIKELADAHRAQYNYISIHNEYSKEINDEIKRIQEEYNTVCSLVDKYDMTYNTGKGES